MANLAVSNNPIYINLEHYGQQVLPNFSRWKRKPFMADKPYYFAEAIHGLLRDWTYNASADL